MRVVEYRCAGARQRQSERVLPLLCWLVLLALSWHAREFDLRSAARAFKVTSRVKISMKMVRKCY